MQTFTAIILKVEYVRKKVNRFPESSKNNLLDVFIELLLLTFRYILKLAFLENSRMKSSNYYQVDVENWYIKCIIYFGKSTNFHRDCLEIKM